MYFEIGCILLISFVSANTASNLKIMGGEPADIKDHPYIVSLYYFGYFWCDGSILDEYTILTAAHCVFRSQLPEDYFISYGNTNVSSGNKMQVTRVTYHANFLYQPPWTYDIAIIKLTEPISFGDTAQPLKLPKSHESTPANKTASLAGWGEDDISPKSQILRAVNLTISTDEECVDSYRNVDGGGLNPKTELCAGVPEGGKGPCHGDSGGPLVIDGVQYGIVSYSKGCVEKGYPAVFTKVSGYLDWIEKHR
ncbi:trypsin-3 [Leptinotarsa decemlineata]|uniref:trypsin-3 n=1 Tax=Leptinotarsa decemlineata TaxID=7539 RepID=UPI000C253981|nr:trypsin-3-like [Leptinotarsa decemlineata]